MKNKNSGFIKALVISYCLIGCVGGAALGFISLGLPGLLLGIAGGSLLGYVLHKSTRLLIKS